MFEGAPGAGGPFWTYRRLIDAAQFDDPRYPQRPGDDQLAGQRLPRRQPDRPSAGGAGRAALRAAKALSLGFLHWLQTEAPRDDGGRGYPELKLRPDVMGTADGLSKYPYIRESRRMRRGAHGRSSRRSGALAAGRARGADAGLGRRRLYAIDIHPAEGETKLPPERRGRSRSRWAR